MKLTQSGFTLIEIIIATAILAVGIVAIMNMFSLGVQIAGFNQKATTAAYLAQARMEEQMSLPYFNLEPSQNTEDYGTIADFQGYKRITDIACIRASDLFAVDCDYDLANDPYPMKKINVSIFWRSSFGGEEDINLSTVMSRR